MKRLLPVVVHWTDPLDSGGTWQQPTDKDPRPVTVRTVGYLKARTPKYIVISRDYFNDTDGTRTHGGLISIPLGIIVKLKYLVEGEDV